VTRTDHWWGPFRVLNTVSNTAYPAVGVGLALWLGTPSAWAFAGAMLLLGLGSAAYHWHRSPATQRLDWLGMALVFGTLATIAANPTGPAGWAIGIGAAVAVGLIYGLDAVGHDAVLGIGLFLSLLPPFWSGFVPASLAVTALGVFLAAKAAHNADRHAGWRSGHAVWHLGTAVAFGLVFLANVGG